MKLHIKIINQSVKELYENHNTYHEGDSGLDLFFCEELYISPKSTEFIDLGIQCEAYSDTSNKNISYYLYPRSSISKTPLRMANSTGIIDAGYRGNIIVAVDNISNHPYKIEKGQRLFQICDPKLDPIYMSVIEELSDTKRGEQGFGSTGK